MNSQCPNYDISDPGEMFEGLSFEHVIQELAIADTDPFLVVRHSKSDGTRPLYVMVFPGDLVEVSYGWEDQYEADAAMAFWKYVGQGLLDEFNSYVGSGYDVVVLHNSRSLHLRYPGTRPGLEANIGEALLGTYKSSTVLWCDTATSERAAIWIAKNLGVADRPLVHLAGSGADPDKGSLSTLGRAFLKEMGEDAISRLEVSPYSPSSAGRGKVWRPDGDEEMVIPDSLNEILDRPARNISL